MAFSIISISSNSSEESVWTSTARVILFGMIPTTIPSTTPTVDLPIIHDDTPLIPTDTLIISPIVSLIPLMASTVQYTSPFLCTNLSNSDTIDTHHPRTRMSGLAQKSVGSLPTHRIALRYLANYASSDQFTSDDSSQDSPSDSSLETSSNSHSNTSSYSSLRHSSLGYSISDSLRDSLNATSTGPSRKRCRDSDLVMDFKVSSEDGYVSYVPRETDIDECFAYADAIRAKGMDVRFVVETVAKEEVESSIRGTTEVEVDLRVKPIIDNDVCESITEDDPDHITADRAVEVTYEKFGVVKKVGIVVVKVMADFSGAVVMHVVAIGVAAMRRFECLWM
nr:hypothetical protein [Tanacetum cinerariifolium]